MARNEPLPLSPSPDDPSPPPHAPPALTPTPALPSAQPPTTAEARENAWRIHQALGDWTARVDNKASFALTLEAASAAGLASLAKDGSFAGRRVDGALSSLVLIALVALLIGALCAIVAIQPRLRTRAARAAAPDNFIYFGHVRHWDPVRLRAALGQEDLLPMLSRQLVVMSQVAWRKHLLVQVSLALAAFAVALVVLVLLLA
ncbi:Pycsar system effector family protein [Streptomyces sp. NPDC058653]|uniref:Pycsar system effector family protein n=1 Tax=Streptomyces sp. NPDC058653 TaxID=3346576 RepID=UPI0036525617